MGDEFFLRELRRGTNHWNKWLDRWIEQEQNKAGVDLRNTWLKEQSETKLRRSIDLSATHLVSFNFRGADLRGMSLRLSDLSRSDLSNSDLTGANLEGSKLIRANLEGAWLRNANLKRANTLFAKFRNADLGFADLSDSLLWDTDFANASFQQADLSGALLDRSIFTGTRFTGADTWLARFSDSSLNDAILYGWDPQGALLSKVNLSGVVLNNVDLTNTMLEDANLSGAHLEGANLTQARLRRADMSETRLGRANLAGADVREVKLVGAQIESANLAGAFMERANLRHANLRGATLVGATLHEADLSDAILRDALGLTFDSNLVRGTDFTSNPFRLRPQKELPFLGDLARSIPRSLISDQIKSRVIGNIEWVYSWVWYQGRLTPRDDKWSLLRREYSGLKLVVIWLALIGAITPRVLLGIWLYISSDIISASDRAMNSDLVFHEGVQSSWQDFLESLEMTPVWRVLLGFTERFWWSLPWATMTFIIVVYAFVRFWLTLQIHPLRDAETRSNRTPAQEDYIYLYDVWHSRIAWIWLIAKGLLCWNIVRVVLWMFSTRVPLL